MFWFLVLLASLVILGLITVLVGRLLPEECHAKVQFELQRSPQELWKELQDYHKHPLSGKMAKRVESRPDVGGLPSWAEDLGSTQITVVTIESRANQKIIRSMKDSVVPLTAHQTIVLEPSGEGTRITAETKTVIKNGTWHVPFFRVMMRLFGGVRAGLVNYVQSIGKTLGEKPRLVA